MKLPLTIAFIVVSTVTVSAQWVKQTVITMASFRGLSVVNAKVVWASGTGGTVIKTTDGGNKWDVITVPGAEKLDFRDIEAFDANTAYILSIGNGDSSRIYKTSDGGKTWKEQFHNKDPKAFFDAIACWSKTKCIAMGDPVDGHYSLIATTDGSTWKPIISNNLPAAWDGEAAFAASGTCLIAVAPSTAFLISGGTDARVFRSADSGKTWKGATTPIVRGTAGSGIFSIAMTGARNGIIVGGNYEKPADTGTAAIDRTAKLPNGYNAAVTADGGLSWRPVVGLSGYRSGVAFMDTKTIIAVGTNGSDISFDGGVTWGKVGNEDLNTVAAKGTTSVWAAGPKGLVLEGSFRKP